MRNSLDIRLQELVEPVCIAHGVELVDVRLMREPGGAVIRIILDRSEPNEREGSAIGVEDCAKVSRDVSAALDVHEDLVPGKFRLEVTSPGLERPLVRLKDFERFRGREAKIKTKAKVADRRNFHGELLGVVEQQVQLKDGPNEFSIPFEEIAKAHLVYRF